MSKKCNSRTVEDLHQTDSEDTLINDNDILHFNKSDITKPITLKQFKRATGLSLKQVKSAIKELKDKGIIREFTHSKKGVMYIVNYDLESMNLQEA